MNFRFAGAILVLVAVLGASGYAVWHHDDPPLVRKTKVVAIQPPPPEPPAPTVGIPPAVHTPADYQEWMQQHETPPAKKHWWKPKPKAVRPAIVVKAPPARPIPEVADVVELDVQKNAVERVLDGVLMFFARHAG
jgi:hypothetical protein